MDILHCLCICCWFRQRFDGTAGFPYYDRDVVPVTSAEVCIFAGHRYKPVSPNDLTHSADKYGVTWICGKCNKQAHKRAGGIAHHCIEENCGINLCSDCHLTYVVHKSDDDTRANPTPEQQMMKYNPNAPRPNGQGLSAADGESIDEMLAKLSNKSEQPKTRVSREEQNFVNTSNGTVPKRRSSKDEKHIMADTTPKRRGSREEQNPVATSNIASTKRRGSREEKHATTAASSTVAKRRGSKDETHTAASTAPKRRGSREEKQITVTATKRRGSKEENHLIISTDYVQNCKQRRGSKDLITPVAHSAAPNTTINAVTNSPTRTQQRRGSRELQPQIFFK